MGAKPRSKSGTSGLKTRPTKVTAAAFVKGVSDERRKRECNTLIKMMREVSGAKPVMWGSSVVGFGTYHYKYASGREGDWPRIGFSPRKQTMTIYCMPGHGTNQDLLSKLGPHKTAVSCLYIRRLDDVDLGVLRKIVERSLDQMARMYPED
jgi:hypothetical protein